MPVRNIMAVLALLAGLLGGKFAEAKTEVGDDPNVEQHRATVSGLSKEEKSLQIATWYCYDENGNSAPCYW